MQPPEDLSRLLPVLVRIQAHLDGDLSLAHLAAVASLSPHHFHRLFHAAIGETLKQYTLRLRLERAAFRLLVLDATVLEIALDAGFNNHETFTRAFKKRFAITPRAFRRAGLNRPAVAPAGRRRKLANMELGCELSRTTVRTFRQTHVAFIRHVGPYESVSDQLWAELTTWAQHRGRGEEQLAFFGIGHDAPGITPPEKLRFDAAIRVDGPFIPEGRIGHQVLAPMHFAVTSHVGHFSTLPTAYQAIGPRLAALEGYRVEGLPVIEIYHTTRVDQHHDLNHTDLCIPVVRVGRR